MTSEHQTGESRANRRHLRVVSRPGERPALPTVAVVICADTRRDWDDLDRSLRSVLDQTARPDEVWLVVERDDLLLRRARRSFAARYPQLRMIVNDRTPGRSGARNTALDHVRTEVVAFVDPDAFAANRDWLALLLAPYADPAVEAVGGAATPSWTLGDIRPPMLPARGGERGELDWVVGCTSPGQPAVQQPAASVMSANMSFRRSVFDAVGGFDEQVDPRVSALGDVERELCVRIRGTRPEAAIVFEPTALVRHRVRPTELTWRNLVQRSYRAGTVRAAVAASVGVDPAQVRPAGLVGSGVRRQIKAAVAPTETHRLRRLSGAGALVLASAATAAGFVSGRIRGAVLVPALDPAVPSRREPLRSATG